MVSIDYSVFFQVANFLVLLIILNLLLYKPILKALNERSRKIGAADQECRQLEADLAKRTADYEARLHQARIDATEVRCNLVREGTEAAARAKEALNREVLDISAEFERNLLDELDRGRETMTRQAERISVEIAERLLGRSIQ